MSLNRRIRRHVVLRNHAKCIESIYAEEIGAAAICENGGSGQTISASGPETCACTDAWAWAGRSMAKLGSDGSSVTQLSSAMNTRAGPEGKSAAGGDAASASASAGGSSTGAGKKVAVSPDRARWMLSLGLGRC